MVAQSSQIPDPSLPLEDRSGDVVTQDIPAKADESTIKKLIQRISSSDEELEAAELLATSRDAGATAIENCNCGEVVTVCGPLRSVTICPADSIPCVEAEIYDGSGRVALIWLGRRQIHGIEPGRVVTVTGRMNTIDGRRTIYNPRYTLRPVAAGE